MKIRIEGNSVRLRLRKSEVSRLATEGQVEETTHFPGKPFLYRLRLQAGQVAMDARYSPEGITVSLPEDWGKAWPGEARVGFEGIQPMEGGRELHILVEKDFICLDRDPSKQQDQYPHPHLEK